MQHFVAEFTELLSPLVDIEHRYPTIDHDVLIDMLVDHLEQGVRISWHDYARELLYKGQLIETIYLKGESKELHYLDARKHWENIPLPVSEGDQLVNAIARVGIALEAHLAYFGLYRDRTLTYAFQGCIKHDLYEFTRKPTS